jgi:predicted transcriptional regulator
MLSIANPLFCVEDKMTADEVRDMLRERINLGSSQKELAKKFGISASYLNDILTGARQPGVSVLDALGLRRVTDYQPNRKPKA